MATPNDIVPLATILARLPDNSSGDISAEDMRDVVSDLYAAITASLWKEGTLTVAAGMSCEFVTTIPASATLINIVFDQVHMQAADGAFIGMQVGSAISYLDQVGDYEGQITNSSGTVARWDTTSNALVGFQQVSTFSADGDVFMIKGSGNKWMIGSNVKGGVNGQTFVAPAGAMGFVDLGANALTRIRAISAGNGFSSGTIRAFWQ